MGNNSPNSLSDWGPGGFFKGSMEGVAPMLAGPLDHFCLKNQWKINVFGSNMSLRVPSVCRAWLGCQEARLAGLAGLPGWLIARLHDCRIARLPDCTIA